MSGKIEMRMSGKIRKGAEKDLKTAIEGLIDERAKVRKVDLEDAEFLFIDSFFGVDCIQATKQSKFKTTFERTYRIDDGWLIFNEYCGDYEDTEEFAQFVAPYLEPQDIEFRDKTVLWDCSEKWGFRIRQDGSVVEIEYIVQETEIVYSSSIPCKHKHTSLEYNSIKNIVPNALVRIEFARKCNYCDEVIGYEQQFFKFEK